jgi:hypothetical protein
VSGRLIQPDRQVEFASPPCIFSGAISRPFAVPFETNRNELAAMTETPTVAVSIPVAWDEVRPGDLVEEYGNRALVSTAAEASDLMFPAIRLHVTVLSSGAAYETTRIVDAASVLTRAARNRRYDASHL